MNKAIVVLSAALLAGCYSMVDSGVDGRLIARTGDADPRCLVPAQPLIPDEPLRLTETRSDSLETMPIGAAVYCFVDPLAPNWTGALRRLSNDTYHIALRMTRFKTGGDGESVRVFHRNAERIVRENGMEGYTILSLTEGIESGMLGAVRYAEGVILIGRGAS